MIASRRLRGERGDTLIEVLVAISILSMAVVAAQAAMSYGQSLGLSSVERTATQGMINGQFSYLRYAKDKAASGDTSGVAFWNALMTQARPDTAAYKVSSQTCNAASNGPLQESGMFYIDESVALNPVAPSTLASSVKAYPMVGSPARPKAPAADPSPGDGIWLLARSSTGSAASPSYVDFYAKACWTSVAGPAMDQSTSVMRLYAQ